MEQEIWVQREAAHCPPDVGAHWVNGFLQDPGNAQPEQARLTGEPRSGSHRCSRTEFWTLLFSCSEGAC